MSFVHLHVHSEYSFRRSTIRLPGLVEKVKSLGMPAVALTDWGVLHGAVDFYERAIRAGVRPILGCEVPVAPVVPRAGPSPAYHLLLLARDRRGYRNLCRLVSTLHLARGGRRAGLDLSMLRAHSEGLIGLSACLEGEVPAALLAGDPTGARRVAESYASIFGEGNYYFELIDNGRPGQEKVNRGLTGLGATMGIPVVATNDCRRLEPEDAELDRVLGCLRDGKRLDSVSHPGARVLRSPDQMAAAFRDCPRAVAQTGEIAERCNVEWTTGALHVPGFEGGPRETPAACLARLVEEGLENRFRTASPGPGNEDPVPPDHRERLAVELTAIGARGDPMVRYFLVAQEIVGWARSHGIPVSPGRGALPGSLVAYALGITDVDPLAHGLLFERFWIPAAGHVPALGIDCAPEGRNRVFRHLSRRYGGGNLARVTTYERLEGRPLLREVGRAVGMSHRRAGRLAKRVPAGMSVQAALREGLVLATPGAPDEAGTVALGRRLEGIRRQAVSQRQSRVVSDRPVEDCLPLYRDAQGRVTTQFDRKGLQSLGFFRVDVCGLEVLSRVARMVKRIGEAAGSTTPFDLAAIPLGEPAVYETILRDPDGVWMLEGQGIRELVRYLEPTRFEDLTALSALYRPGPLRSGMVENYLDRKRGTLPAATPLHEVEPVLAETHGVIVYQEQVLEIARVVAGYAPEQAARLRRVLAKHEAASVRAHRGYFLDGARDHGVDPGRAGKLFDEMALMARHTFLKSHAVAYALLTYQTAYLKTFYPEVFRAVDSEL